MISEQKTQEKIKHKPKWHWFQFRLRTLLVLTTLIALLMPWSVPVANQWIAYYSMTAEERERVRRYQHIIDELWETESGHGDIEEVFIGYPQKEYWEELNQRKTKYSSIQPNDEPKPVTSP